MKTTQKLLLSLLALTLFGCGGSSSFSAKNPFGEIPNLFVKFEAETPSVKGMANKDITREMTKEILDKTQILIEQIKQEAPKIIGNKVPFSGNPSPLFEVTDCIISSAERRMNECQVEVEVFYKVKSDLTADTQESASEKLYAIFVDHSDNLLHYAKLRTSTSGDANKSVKLLLQLPRQNLVDFKEIRIVAEDEFQRIVANYK